MFDFEGRRIFNKLLFEEILRDYKKKNISSFVDFGCGDGYFIKLMKHKYPSSTSVCVERKIEIAAKNTLIDTILEYSQFLKAYTNFIRHFDIITVIDVLYLLPQKEIENLLYIFNNIIKDNGIIYVLLGVYTGSRAINLFDDILINVKHEHSISNFLPLQNYVEMFLNSNFDVFVKRLKLEDTFGFKIDYKFKDNVKSYIDYLYEDKLLIKLIKKKE